MAASDLGRGPANERMKNSAIANMKLKEYIPQCVGVKEIESRMVLGDKRDILSHVLSLISSNDGRVDSIVSSEEYDNLGEGSCMMLWCSCPISRTGRP